MSTQESNSAKKYKIDPKILCGCGRSFTKRGMSIHKCDKKPSSYICEFCKIELTSESRLFNHLCETKRRYLQREDPSTRRGFIAYERFYQRSMKRIRTTTYDDFSRSPFYGAFVKFGKYTIDVNVVNLIGYIDFLLRTEVPVDRWTNQALYQTYVRELNKTEPPLDALERVFKVMQQWSMETGEEWTEFFRKVEAPRATLWIINGKLSPWVLFTASSAHDLLSRLPIEQAMMVAKAIDADFWQHKIERNQQEVDIIRQMLAENGI